MQINADSKRAIQKAGGAIGDLIGNITVYKITNFSKKSSKNNLDEANNEMKIAKEIYTSLEKGN